MDRLDRLDSKSRIYKKYFFIRRLYGNGHLLDKNLSNSTHLNKKPHNSNEKPMKLTVKTSAQWRKEHRAERGQDQDEGQDQDPNLIEGVPAAQTRRAIKGSKGKHQDIPF